MRLISVAIVLSAFVATPAFAQGRIEARIGYDEVNQNEDIGEASLDGLVYGVEAGYDFPVGGSFFVGPYANFELSDAEDFDESDPDNDFARINESFAFGGRLGINADVARIYAKVGYVTMKLAAGSDDTGESFSIEESLSGFQVGGGAEVDVVSNVYIKAELVYSDLNSEIIEGVEVDLDRLQVMGGVGIRF